MPVVQMPDGALVDMPDNPTPKQLAELQLLTSPSATPKRSMSDEFMRQLGLTARIPAHIATGTAGVAADAASGLYNTVADKAGVGGPRFNKVTPSLNRILDEFLPSPETPLEHGVQFAGSLFGGSGDIANRAVQGSIARMAPTQLAPGIQISELAKKAAAPQNSGPGISDALADASRNVLQHSKFRHLLGGLDKADPVTLGLMGLMAGGPFGMAAAAIPAVAKTLSRHTPQAVQKAAPVASTLPARLANGRFISAAQLAKSQPLSEMAGTMMERQIGIGMLPPLFSMGEQ